MLGGKGGAAGVGADSAHGKVKAYVDKGILGQLVVVLRLAQLPRRVGIDRCGEGLFRVQGKQSLHAEMRAGVVASRFLRTQISVLVVLLCGAFVIAVIAGHVLVRIALVGAVAHVGEGIKGPLHAKLQAKARKLLDVVGKAIGKPQDKLRALHAVFRRKACAGLEAVGCQCALKAIAVCQMLAGKDVRTANVKAGMLVQMREQMAVVVDIAGHVKVHGCGEDLASVRLDRGQKPRMLVGQNGKRLRAERGVGQGRDLSHGGGELSAVNGLHLQRARFEPAVGGEETVHAEVAVMLGLAKVAAVA